jgi:hypothetical protein
VDLCVDAVSRIELLKRLRGIEEIMFERSIFANLLSSASGDLPALLITLGFATLVGCAMSVVCLLFEDEDELFKIGDRGSYLKEKGN